MTDEIKNKIIEEYINGTSINQLHLKYNIKYSTVKNCILRNNVPDNFSGRFSQKYENCGEYTKIYIKHKGGFIYSLIDTEDVEKCKSIGIWSVSKDGYVENCTTGIYLHRFVMNCPKDMEIDHIYHDPLDNRKSQLRFATSSQQKMNTKKRKDNTSGQRGVYYDKSRDTWNVNINIHDMHFRKRYKTYDEAVERANQIYETYFGDFKYKDKPIKNLSQTIDILETI